MPHPSETSIDITLLQVGYCTGPLAMTERGLPLHNLRKAIFPAGIALLRHPTHGHVLFDTGYGKLFWDATQCMPERIYRWLTPAFLAPQESLAKQLQRLGIDDLHMVFLSHLHADHVSGLFDLAAIPRVMASAAALRNLNKDRLATLNAGCPEKIRDALRVLPIEATDKLPLTDLSPHGLAAFGSGHDLFGDGSALIVSLPGHGYGQLGLFMPHTSSGRVFLVADAIWSLDALRRNAPPPDITLSRLGNRQAYLSTFAKLYAFHQSHPEMKIIASHCRKSYPPKNAAEQA